MIKKNNNEMNGTIDIEDWKCLRAFYSQHSTCIGNQFIESHDDEVEFPNDENSRYMSSTGGGDFCEYDFDFYNGYEGFVAFVEENSVKADHDNLHDVNVGESPSNFTANLKKGKHVAFPVVANYFRNTWGKYGLVKSMLNSSTGIFSFQFSSIDGLDEVIENGPWFIRNNPLILKKWNPDVNLMKEDVGNVLVWVKLHGVLVTAFSEDGLSAIATKLALIEVRAYVELKDNIMVAMPKLFREGFYTCIIRVKYEWKPPRCACCKAFGHVQDECPKIIDLDVVKNMKKPNQATIGVPVGPKVENNVDLGTNGGTSNLAIKKANFSGSSFWNVESSSISTTPLVEKIEKIERLIIDGKVTLVDDEGRPLTKVDYLGDHDSKNEVASVDNVMEFFLASKKDIPDQIQDICDNLDIKVQGRKKK
ncbi:putative RNA-directed DNA polymerase [Tanacetum coccineum]